MFTCIIMYNYTCVHVHVRMAMQKSGLKIMIVLTKISYHYLVIYTGTRKTIVALKKFTRLPVENDQIISI